jgi:hypothetical protein
MSWIAVGTMVGTAALGYNQQKQQQKQMAKYNQGQAEMTRYSPWTGVKGQTQMDSSDPLGGAIQGGLSGLALGNNISKLNFGGAPQKPMGDISMNTTDMQKADNLDPMGQENQTLFGTMKKQNPYRRDPSSVA